MQATATRKKPSAVLKTELGIDGKLKHTLPAKEAAKLTKAYSLCCLVGGVGALQAEAVRAAEGLFQLMNTLGVEPDELENGPGT